MRRRTLTVEVVQGDSKIDLSQLSRLLATSAVRQHLEDAERAEAHRAAGKTPPPTPPST